MNRKMWCWFDEGRALDVLVGDGEFFTPDHTWRDHHDTTLVLGQLAHWAETKNKQADSENAFVEALKLFASSNRTIEAFRLVLSYLVILDESDERLLIDMEQVIHILADLAFRQAPLLATDTEIRQTVLDVSTRLPRLAKRLGLPVGPC